MRPILPQEKSLIRPENNKITNRYAHYKERDAIEWNKYAYRKRRNEDGDIELSKFVFQDRELYEIYVK